jgi:RNA-binding protein YlmH
MTTSDPKPTSWTIQATGHRVDRELKQMFPSLSNQVIKQWLAQKGVQLNNKYANKGMRVKTGDIITILDPGPIPSQEASFAPVTTQASESLREDIL